MKSHALLLLTVGVLLAAADPKGAAKREVLDHNSRAVEYIIKGDYDKAISECTVAIRLDPEKITSYLNRGSAYVLEGEPDKAIVDFDQVIRLDPKDATGHNNRAAAHSGKGDYRKAVSDYRDAMRVAPKKHDSYAYLADLLATCPKRALRDGKNAVELGTKACELTKWNDFISLSALAAAYAEVGECKKAVEWQEKAMDAKGSLIYKRKRDVEESRKRLENYKEGKPARRSVPNATPSPVSSSAK
jgi:tetratricopeptide (TPR) repeat protein